MRETHAVAPPGAHSHVFLGAEHAHGERRSWAVIYLCGAMMLAEIVGGWLTGSIALIADGLHMSTHASALLLAALAYSYARRHAEDPRFTFGTGKLGDLAGFTSAIILAMIALLVGYEAFGRLLEPVPIRFAEAIPIAAIGLAVNLASAWLLSGGGHRHGHHHGHVDARHEHAHHEHVHHEHERGHGQAHAHPGHHHDAVRRIATAAGEVVLEIFEAGVPPRFRLRADAAGLAAASVAVETVRPDGGRQTFTFVDRGRYLESLDEIPEPHAFAVELRIGGERHATLFEEHEHAQATAHRDNNLRAAVIHVMADAAVSALVILGLVLARAFGWLWMDPLAGIVGAAVIASWSYGLIRDTGAILLDIVPDRRMAESLRQAIEGEGDEIADLHLWRLGPGHLGAILAVSTSERRGPDYYRARLARFRSLSHLTVEVRSR
jgi:cation diffusion facilitator family transporter